MAGSFSRRSLLRAGIAGTATATLWTPGLWNPARAAAWTHTLARTTDPTGTTLAATIVAASAQGYTRLTEGPGWPLVTRADLGALAEGRDAVRRPIATIVHLTDVHIIDAQSPGRVEFLDDRASLFSAAFRPQETLTTHVQTSMVERINSLGAGPVTGRPFDCAVSTGDNIDNQQHNELEWFMAVLDGGELAANSGDAERYEGVQLAEWADPRYWHPTGEVADRYRERGFPTIDGLLDAAIGSFSSPGLDVPWYSTYGNHDGLIQGNLPRSDAADELLMASVKATDVEPGASPFAFIAGMLTNAADVAESIRAGRIPSRPVTPDEARRTLTTDEWIRAHLDSPAPAGAKGHGYTEDHLENSGLYYRFQIAPGVVGLSLDTGGFNSGSIGEGQMQWLEQELASVHSRHFDAGGAEVRTGQDDQIVLLFSHFTIETMGGFMPDPARPDERRFVGQQVVEFLHRWPNIVAWVNGHTHSNSVRPVPDPAGRVPGFWQITTASHVDWPEQARIVELADNLDGTVSIFCTMIEHAAAPAADYDDLSAMGLASISRELSANNDIDANDRQLGDVDSLNVELGWRAPFDLAAAGIGADVTTTTVPSTASVTGDDDSNAAAWLLGGVGVLAVGATGAAIAVRRRRDRGPDEAGPEDARPVEDQADAPPS